MTSVDRAVAVERASTRVIENGTHTQMKKRMKVPVGCVDYLCQYCDHTCNLYSRCSAAYSVENVICCAFIEGSCCLCCKCSNCIYNCVREGLCFSDSMWRNHSHWTIPPVQLCPCGMCRIKGGAPVKMCMD